MKRSAFLLVLCAGGLLAADAVIPDTPAGRQFRGWLTAFNTGDRATVLKFMQENYPARVAGIDGTMNFREQTGGFDLLRIDESAAARIVATMKERDSNTYVRATMETDAAPPHQIQRIGVGMIPRPADIPAPPRLSEAGAIAALRAEAEKQASRDRFSGAVLVARNGKTLFSAAHGMADREAKTPNTTKTRFRLGSMNKMFTAIAILQLAQAGKLSLQDTVGKHLTDYPNKDVASKVTIHHLLTHTGGTGDIFGPQYNQHRLKLADLKDYVDLYGSRAPAFEPGARFAYSNYGFLLLGVLVERITGKSYYDYVRENIYKRAGMASSDSLPETDKVTDRSVGYMRAEGGGWKPNNDTLPVRGTSAGGGYSTVEDLLRFATALTSHKLLDAEHTRLLTTGKVEAMGARKYAYGFLDGVADGVRSFGHGGGAPGMNGELSIYPDSGYVVVALANLDPPAAGRLADFIGDRLPAK